MKWMEKTDLLAWCEQNGERGQQLIEEWNEDKNFNEYGQPVIMQDFCCFSNKKAWWKCRGCGHEWQASIYNRVRNGSNCHKCAKKIVSQRNRERALEKGIKFIDWCRQNGEWGKLLMDEWDYNKNRKELNREPEEITNGSNEKIYWICKRCNNSFQMTLSTRTYQLSGCQCRLGSGTSYPEQFIFHALKQIYPATLNRAKLFDGIEYDIVIPEEKLCIEYNGGYWHSSKEKRDNMKEQLCIENGYRFIRVEDSNSSDDVCHDGNYIKIPKKSRGNRYYHLQEVVKCIILVLGNENKVFNSILADERAMETLCKGENRLEKEFPELMKEWGDERKPIFYSSASHAKITWQCTKCNRLWESTIADRVRMKTGCIHCGYNIFDGRIHNHAIKIKHDIVSLSYYT